MAETATSETYPDKIPYKTLKVCHAEYDPSELLTNTALYEGGKTFDAVKDKLLRHRDFERSGLPGGKKLREARLAAAQYEPILAGIFDYLSSATLTEPLQVQVDANAPEETRAAYDKLNKGLHALAQTRLTNCNVHKRTYIAIQFPAQTPAKDKAEQKRAGLLMPSFVAVDAPEVEDWQCDSDGKLEWARLHRSACVQPTPFTPPTHIRHCWEFWTKTAIIEYAIDKEIKDGQPAELCDDDEATRVDVRSHDLGAVPLIQLSLPVYVIDRLKPIAISLFNRSTSIEYSLDASAYQQGFIRTDNKDFASLIISESTFIKLSASGNEAIGYAGPDTQHLVQLSADCERLDRNMYKAIQAGALRVTSTEGNTSRMSGISRMHEHGSIAVLLGAYANALLDAFGSALELVQAARKESDTVKAWIGGCSRFDLLDTEKDLEAVEKLFGFGDHCPPSARAFVMEKLIDAFCYDAPQDVRKKIKLELAAVSAKPAAKTEPLPQPENKERPNGTSAKIWIDGEGRQ